MTYAASKKLINRIVRTAVEVDLDYCGNCFGCSDSPCQATAGNDLTRSEEFDHSDWIKGGATVVANDALAPDGTTTMDRVTGDGVNSWSQVYETKTVSYSAGDSIVQSLFVRPNDAPFVGLYLYNNTATKAAYVVWSWDGSQFAVSQASGSGGAIVWTDYGFVVNNDGAYRFYAVGSMNDACASIVYGPHVGWGAATTGYHWFWGAQLHKGTSLQPYTKTTSAAIAANTTGQPCFNTYATCQDKANFNNSGVKFDGVDDYIQIADASSLDIGTSDFSLEILLKADSVSGIQGVFSKRGSAAAGTNPGWGLRFNGTSVGIELDDGTANSIAGNVFGTGTISAGDTQHIAVTFDRSGNADLYIDGIYQSSIDISAVGDVSGTNPVRVGCAANTTVYIFAGTVYYARLYDRTLSAEEVWTNYKNLNPYSSGGAVLDLPLNEGAGTTATDYSGNGNDGTLTNGPTWVKGAPKTYRITDGLVDLPDGDDYLPLLYKSDTAQSRISPGQGVKLGDLGGVQVQCFDGPHHDRGIDPYWRYRSYDPSAQGTFFGKLKARNPYYEGRTLRIRSGYVNDPFSWDDFITRTYRFGGWTGPDKNGIVKLNGLDMMLAVSDDKIKVPQVTTGTLDAALAAGSTADFSVTGDSDKYAASGYLAIDSEIIGYTGSSISGDTITFTGITRGADGKTTDADHSAGASVQRCEYLSGTARDLYETLLTTYGGVDSGYLNTTAWDTLAAVWFVQVYSRYIPKPTGLTTLLNQLMIETQSFVWWDEENALFQLGAIKPADSGLTTYDEDSNLVAGSVEIQELKDQRVSDVVVYCNPITPFESEDPQYWSSYENIDLTTESQNEYGVSKQKEIYAYWIGSAGQASMLSGRHLSRYRDNDKRIFFEMDAKDSSLAVGGDCYINSRQIQDQYGANNDTLIQIIQRDEIEIGHRYRYTAFLNLFSGRYGRIMASSASSTYSAATDAEKADGCYIVSLASSPSFSDGGSAYKFA